MEISIFSILKPSVNRGLIEDLKHSYLQSRLSGIHVVLIVHGAGVTSLQIQIHLWSFHQHHVDKGDQQIGGAMFTERFLKVGSVHDPFDEYHEYEVTKYPEKEHKLRYELQENLTVLPFVDLIPQTEHHTESHVDNSKNERYFHLVCVEEANLVGC